MGRAKQAQSQAASSTGQDHPKAVALTELEERRQAVKAIVGWVDEFLAQYKPDPASAPRTPRATASSIKGMSADTAMLFLQMHDLVDSFRIARPVLMRIVEGEVPVDAMIFASISMVRALRLGGKRAEKAIPGWDPKVARLVLGVMLGTVTEIAMAEGIAFGDVSAIRAGGESPQDLARGESQLSTIRHALKRAQKKPSDPPPPAVRRDASWFTLITKEALYPDLLRMAAQGGRLKSSRKVANRWHHSVAEVAELYPQYRHMLEAGLQSETQRNEPKEIAPKAPRAT